MDALSISEAQQQVDQWIKTYGVRYFNELTNMAILTEEVGELARIIARTYGEQSSKESDKNRDLGDEWQMYYGYYFVWQPNRRRSYGCLPQKS